ncbi:MAG: hypothetical protein ACKOQY_04910 [Bacteroidota bacterium]
MKPLLAFIAASLILVTLTGVAVHTISTPKNNPVDSPLPEDETDIKLNRPTYDTPGWNEHDVKQERRDLHATGHTVTRVMNTSGQSTLTYKAIYHDPVTGQRVMVYVD